MHIDRTSEFLNRLVDDNPERVVAAMNEMVNAAGRAAQASASIALDGVAPAKGAASRPTTPPEARQAKQGPETESGKER